MRHTNFAKSRMKVSRNKNNLINLISSAPTLRETRSFNVLYARSVELGCACVTRLYFCHSNVVFQMTKHFFFFFFFLELLSHRRTSLRSAGTPCWSSKTFPARRPAPPRSRSWCAGLAPSSRLWCWMAWWDPLLWCSSPLVADLLSLPVPRLDRHGPHFLRRSSARWRRRPWLCPSTSASRRFRASSTTTLCSSHASQTPNPAPRAELGRGTRSRWRSVSGASEDDNSLSGPSLVISLRIEPVSTSCSAKK